MTSSQDTKRVGLAFWPGTPVSEILEIGKLADKAGIDSLWVTESTLAPGRDAVSILGALSAVTSKVKLATGIINIFTRTPTLIASTAATLDELSNDRTIIGLGTGHQDSVTRWHGVQFQQPLTRMREYVNAVRAILSGETVTQRGKTISIDGFRLATKPRRQVPIYIATVGPRMAKLAGELADGALITMNTVPQVTRLLDIAKTAARDRGRAFDGAAYALSFLSEDNEKNIQAAKRVLAMYCAAPFYNKAFTDAGYVKESRDISRIIHTGDREKASEHVTDEMIADYAALGPDQITEKIENYRAAGVTLPIISVAHMDSSRKMVTELVREISG